MQLNSYATLAMFRDRLGLAAADTGDDARLLARLRAATAQIDRYVGRHFWPLVATRRFDWRNARTLLFRGFDLLEITSITNGDGSTVDPTAILTLGGVMGPIVGVELDISKAFFVYQTTTTRAIAVTGVWGWHNDYANAGWKLSGDTIPGGGITGSATSFTVTNVSGSDSWGLTPRFSAGQLIKVDSEFMQVVATNSSTNTLTVVRAANGSAAASHSAGATISIYTPPADIQEIALRWADWLYRMEDAAVFDLTRNDSATAAIGAPPAIPRDLLAALSNVRLLGGVA